MISLVMVSMACQSRTDPWGEVPVVLEAGQKTTLEKYRTALLGADREPAGSPKLEIAVKALAEADAEEAQAILKEVLATYRDPKKTPDSTTQLILDTLTSRLALDLDLKRNEKRKRRLEIYQSYLPRFVEIHAWKDGEGLGLADRVERFFRLMPDEITRPMLERALAHPEPETVRAVLEIAGVTEDPKLAAAVAPILANLELRSLAQETLAKLTLRIKPFADLEDFRAWEVKNRSKSYEELAKETALQSLELARQFEERAKAQAQQSSDKAFLLVRRIIALGMSQTNPPWDEFLFLLESQDLARHQVRILEALYEGLHKRAMKPAEAKARIRDLERLMTGVKQGYQRSGGDQRVAWLSVYAYLAYLSGGKDAEEVVGILLADLQQPLGSIPSKRVVELLTLFPSDGVRAKVFEHVRSRRLAEDAAGVESGIACLKGLGIPTQPELVTKLRDELLACVRDKKLPLRSRDQALDILGELGHELVASALRGIVQPWDRRKKETPGEIDSVEEALRLKALAWGNTKIASELQAAPPQQLNDLIRAELDFLLTCIWDESDRLRKESGKALEDFPPSVVPLKADRRRQYALQIVSDVGGTLAAEQSPGCIGQFRETILKQAKVHHVSTLALQKLIETLVAWSSKGETRPEWRKQLEIQLPAMNDALGSLIRSDEVGADTILAATKRLIDAGLGESAQRLLDSTILDRLSQETSPGTADRDKLEKLRLTQLSQRGRLFLRLLDLSDGLDALPLPRRKRIAALLIRYQSSLEKLAGDQPRIQVHLGQAHALLGEPGKAVVLFESWRKGPGLDAKVAMRNRVRRLEADAWYELEDYDKSADLLEGLTDLSSLLLRGRALIKSERWVEAEGLYRNLRDNPVLAAEGPDREEASLGFCEALLGQEKFTELSDFESVLRPFKDKGLAARYKELHARKKALLEARKKERSKDGESGKGPAPKSPAPGKGQPKKGEFGGASKPGR